MQHTEHQESDSKLAQASELKEQSVVEGTAAASKFRVIRRNGKVTDYDQSKIEVAMTKAFLAVEGGQAAASRRVRETVEKLGKQVYQALFRHMEDGGTVHIEDIQDQVELSMMRAGEHKAARDFVLYRAKQAEKRARAKAREEKQQETVVEAPVLHVIDKDGNRKALDFSRIETVVAEATRGLKGVTKDLVLKDLKRNIFDGMAEDDLNASIVMSARVLIEKDPNYSFVTARLLMDGIRREALSFIYNQEKEATQKDMESIYPEYFSQYIHRAADLKLLDRELTLYNLEKLGVVNVLGFGYTSHSRFVYHLGYTILLALGMAHCFQKYFCNRSTIYFTVFNFSSYAYAP